MSFSTDAADKFLKNVSPFCVFVNEEITRGFEIAHEVSRVSLAIVWRRPSAGSTLCQRLRRWPSVEPALGAQVLAPPVRIYSSKRSPPPHLPVRDSTSLKGPLPNSPRNLCCALGCGRRCPGVSFITWRKIIPSPRWNLPLEPPSVPRSQHLILNWLLSFHLHACKSRKH